MAGMAGLTAEEQRIYDEFSAGMRALSDKAKSDAKAIGADIMSIIGPTEAAVVSDVKKMEGAIVKWWGYLLRFLDFLDDPRGKFSYKRGSGVAALVTSFIFAAKGDLTFYLLYFAGAVAIAIVCGVTHS